MEMEWREGWAGLPDATAGFHDGVVHGLDLTSQSYVRSDLSMVSPDAPADVRLFVQFQNKRCPAVLLDFVTVVECNWDNSRNLDYIEPEVVDSEFNRYSLLQVTVVATGVFWLPLDERALRWGRNAARHHRATGYSPEALTARDEAAEGEPDDGGAPGP